MKTLTVKLGERSYPIYIGTKLFQEEIIEQYLTGSKQIAIITNQTVAPIYLDQLLSIIKEKQIEVVVLPDGEEYKDLDHLKLIFDHLLEKKFSRNSTLIALGGGVIGDMCGFAAACYQRGVAFMQIPTTLLAQVDSSVGGKTGVNHSLGKNMIGAFYQPKCVIADMDTLVTLDDRQFSAGLAEVIKYGLIRDADFFAWLEANIKKLVNRDMGSLEYAVQRSCINKAEVVEADERESGVRATLNLGHTFGHAIETGSGYGNYLHGEAVAIGTCLAADLSRRMGMLNNNDVGRIESIFHLAGLPTKKPVGLEANQMIELMTVDKKNIDGRIKLIMLETIGKATLPVTVETHLLLETLQSYGRE